MQESTESDVLIVQLLQNKATLDKGFKLLVENYSQRLYWHIRSMLKNHADTDDVVQNTFIKVFKGINGFKSEAKLYTWLYRIATNESLTFLKKRKSAMDTDLLQHHTATAHYDEESTVQKLDKAIELLPQKQKLVFNLRYFEEMTYQDMADITGTSVGALKASYHHAVKKLETYLKTNNIH